MNYLSNAYAAVNQWLLPSYPINHIPLATRMHDETTSIHEELENHLFIKNLLSNQLSIKEYKQYLTDLQVVYLTLECELKRYRHSHFIQPFFIENLFRSSFINEDLSQPLFQSTKTCNPTNSALEYCEHLEKIAKDNPLYLLAHFYVRYLGDLSGGLFIKNCIKKQWPEAIHFYDFSSLIKEFESISQFKKYYKNSINKLELNDFQNNKMIEEVLYAYHQAKKMMDSI